MLQWRSWIHRVIISFWCPIITLTRLIKLPAKYGAQPRSWDSLQPKYLGGTVINNNGDPTRSIVIWVDWFLCVHIMKYFLLSLVTRAVRVCCKYIDRPSGDALLIHFRRNVMKYHSITSRFCSSLICYCHVHPLIYLVHVFYGRIWFLQSSRQSDRQEARQTMIQTNRQTNTHRQTHIHQSTNLHSQTADKDSTNRPITHTQTKRHIQR